MKISDQGRSSRTGLGEVTSFSAGQIARAVGVSPRAIRETLSGVMPVGESTRSGNRCAAFTVDQLPDRVRSKIAQQQTALHYRTPEAVIASPKKQWEPLQPLSAQPPEAIEYAHCLQRALAYYIAQRGNASLRPADLMARVSKDWEAAFKKPAQRRHIERVADMVMFRDNGREEFDRIEIYLPAKSSKFAAKSQNATVELTTLAEALHTISDVATLAPADKGTIWRAALVDFEILVAQGVKDKKAKRHIFDFITARIPRLAESRNALRMQFERKWSAYEKEGIAAIRDKRSENSGRRSRKAYTGPESLTEDERILLDRANRVGGGLSQAFRELHQGIEIVSGKSVQFSEAFRETYSFDPRANKSYVPQTLRDKLRPLLKAIEPLNHGPKTARLAGPSIHRDWSNVAAGAWYQSDDETANHYIYNICEDGEFEFQGTRFDVLRPQILPLVDVRTDYVLSVVLLCQRQYNSRSIRSLILRTCMDERIGLPFEGFYFENGIWRSRNVQALVNWTEVDDAFSRSGLSLRLRHATTPKAKIIERIFSREQNAMQELPGYAGRDERNDRYERVQKFIASLKRVGQPLKAEVDPSAGLLSATQYLDHLHRAYKRFNREPQNGKRLQGRSPAEGWKEFSGGRAHQVLPDSLRYLLATEQTEKPVTVTREGICLRVGNVSRYFFESAKLGTLIGEKVTVRWNPDFPNHIVVVHPKSDPMAQFPFVVNCARELDAMEATKEDIAEARKSRRVFTQPSRTLFRVLDHEYGKTVRDELLGGFAPVLSGEAHNDAVNQHLEKTIDRKANEVKARKLAHRAGFDSSKITDVRRAVDELSDIDALEARLLQEETENE